MSSEIEKVNQPYDILRIILISFVTVLKVEFDSKTVFEIFVIF
jgi:hypothetical protein